MPSPLCLDRAEAHVWISDPNSERCHLHLGQGGCSALSEGVQLGRKGLIPKGQKAGRPQGCPCACPALGQPWYCERLWESLYKGLCEGRGIPLTPSCMEAKAKGAQGHQGALVLSWK